MICNLGSQDFRSTGLDDFTLKENGKRLKEISPREKKKEP